MRRTVRIIIEGRVQGVGYRAWTYDAAIGRNLDGWVRNRDDGTVEALFAGEATQIDAMIEACRTGPRHARVSRVEEFSEVASPGAGFRII